MRLCSLASGFLIGFFTGATPVLLAHGGNYRGGVYPGPGDTVPGGGGGGGGRSPNPAGPTTPGPGGPTTPTPAGPSTPGTGPTTPTGPSGPRAGPTTGGPRGIQIGEDLTGWTYWWENNKAPFLQLRQAIQAPTATTGSDDYLMGRGLLSAARDSLAPSAKDLQEVLIPALTRALEDRTSNRDIVSSSMIGLARVGKAAGALALLRKQLVSRDQEIRESAALAMGILGDPAAVSDLLALARDEQAGRQLVERNEVDYRTRSFSCYGLGLIAVRSGDDGLKTRMFLALRELAGSGKVVRRDIKVAALHAIRLLKPSGETPAGKALTGEAVSFLTEFLTKRGEYPIVRSHAYTALADVVGRDASPALRKRLVAVLKNRRERAWIQQSVALALGQMARPDDTAARVELLAYLRKGKDLQARNFCAIALGQIGGPSIRAALLEMLLARRTQILRKPWIALGLAILDRRAREADPARTVDRTSAEAILAEFRRVRNPQMASGFAIALGLMRYRESGGLLLERMLEARNQDELVGYLAVALGLMQFREAGEDINAIVDRSLRRAGVMTQCSIALGLLGDKSIALRLTERLRDRGQVVAVQAALASALGYIGDRRTIAPLALQLEDRKLKDLSRAFAAVALGLVGDKEMLPWNSKIAVNINYRANVETLSNRITGILDIL